VVEVVVGVVVRVVVGVAVAVAVGVVVVVAVAVGVVVVVAAVVAVGEDFVTPSPKPRRLNLMVIGHGRHGKDTVSALIADQFDLTWGASSFLLSERVVYPVLKDRYGYRSVAECFDDRSNHRAEWFDTIAAYNAGDPARFTRELYDVYDIYCGLRNRDEFVAARKEGLIDLTIWVDASERMPPEDSASCTVTKADADIVIDNNGTEAELERRLINLARVLRA